MGCGSQDHAKVELELRSDSEGSHPWKEGPLPCGNRLRDFLFMAFINYGSVVPGQKARLRT